MYLVADYWVDSGNLDCITGGGKLQAMPLDARDIPITLQLNAERGLPFIVTGGDR